jgi:hypothetical protein
MALKINASSLFSSHYLTVKSDGVKFFEGAVGVSARSFRFNQIECVLMSPDHQLSCQVGQEVFTIPTKPENARHQQVIATLVQELQRTGEGWSG